MQPRLNTKGKSDDESEEREVEEVDQRSSTVSTVRSPSQPDIEMGSLGVGEDDSQKPTSPSSVANQRCVYLLFVSVDITSWSHGSHCHVALRHGDKGFDHSKFGMLGRHQ